MSKNTYTFDLPDSFFDTQRILKNIASSFEILNKVNEGFSVAEKLSGMYAVLESYQSVVRKVYSNDTYENIMKSVTTTQSILANIQIPTTVNLVATMEKILPTIDKNWEVPTVDWDWVSKTLDTYDNCERENVEELLTDDVREEMNESLQETLSTNHSLKSIEQRYGEWKEKHPLLADLYLQLIGLLLGILGGLITSCIPATVNKNTNVYEAPTATSNVVINIDIDQNITVINEAPYYFEVIYTHPETGEEITGFIYKPNVSMPQDSDEIEDIETGNSNTQ